MSLREIFRSTLVTRAILGIGACFLVPYIVWRALRDSHFRSTLPERFGSGAWKGMFSDRRSHPQAPLIWLHAASLGELEGAIPLFKLLRERTPDIQLLLTVTSLTGKRAAESRAIAQHVLFLPLDLPFLVHSIVRKVNPNAVVIFETEIWPQFLHALRQEGVPTVIVNGRIADGTFARYEKLRTLLAPALKAIETYFVQSPLDRERYVAIGAERGRIQVSGSTKYDQRAPDFSELELEEFRRSLGFADDALVFVAGSVRQEEDEKVIQAYVEAKSKSPSLAMVIAPRHPERFDSVARLLEGYRIRFHRRSSGSASGRVDVVLLDSLGELKRAYAIAKISFVGGTLVPIGGHNPFEPAMFSSPVILGPSTENVREAINELKRQGGVFQVEDVTQLAATINLLANDEELRVETGKRAYSAWHTNLGVTDHIFSELFRSMKSARSSEERERIVHGM